MARDFNLKKFKEDRDKSLEGSKKGDYKMIAPSKVDTHIEVIRERYDKEHHPLFEKAESCGNKLAVGCKIPFHKRTKPECAACL